MASSIRVALKPPIGYFAMYCIACCVIPASMFLPSYFIPMTLIAMICVHHGTHEAVHGTLYPAEGRHVTANLLLGAIGFANFGHNFIFLRWSHMAHHRYGRTKRDGLLVLDGDYSRSGRRGRLFYYASLLGQACVTHELVGYLYLFNSRFHLLPRSFPKSCHDNPSYWAIQLSTALYTMLLFVLGGWKFLVCKSLFTLYWGAFQNTAHYGLEYGSANDKYASRTYRVAMWYECLIFRSGTYHLEHHVLPNVPGPCLDHPDVQQRVTAIVGFKPEPVCGLLTYWGDCIRQFRGPRSKEMSPMQWRSDTSR